MNGTRTLLETLVGSGLDVCGDSNMVFWTRAILARAQFPGGCTHRCADRVAGHRAEAAGQYMGITGAGSGAPTTGAPSFVQGQTTLA